MSDEQLGKVFSEFVTKTDLSSVRHFGERNLDITVNNVNKYLTLCKLDIKEYIAFGNDQNDIVMLEHAKQDIWITSKTNSSLEGIKEFSATILEIQQLLRQLI